MSAGGEFPPPRAVSAGGAVLGGGSVSGGGRSGRGGSAGARVPGRSGRGRNAVIPGVGDGGRARLSSLRGRGMDAPPPVIDENEDSGGEELHFVNNDKAKWTDERTKILLDCAIEQGNTVDGSTSYVAGQSEPTQQIQELYEQEEEEEIEEDESFRSPVSSGTKRKSSSTTDTASSPGKKMKSLVLKCMQGLVANLQTNTNKELELARQIQEFSMQAQVKAQAECKQKEQEVQDKEIDQCLQMTIDCGAIEETNEFFVATRLFKDRYNMPAACTLYMYHCQTHCLKSEYRVPTKSGYQWVLRRLGATPGGYNNFWMERNVFDRLHSVLVQSYGLKSTKKMSSVESLGLFLWMCGCPQSMRQAEDRFFRSKETCSRKFDKVLTCLNILAADIIRPLDLEFRTVHPRLQSARFSPYFDNCIGAIDGTHVPVNVPSSKLVQRMGRKGITTQNVLAICDFNIRFTFVVTGWLGSVHDTRVFNDALEKHADKFSHPPEGKFYLVDSGYPNRTGVRSIIYRNTRMGPMPRDKKKIFNYTYSSLRNVIERSFGVLKNKWKILKHLPSYPMHKQSKIIMACMAVTNFIRESAMTDEEIDKCDVDENYVPDEPGGASTSQANIASSSRVEEDHNMNQFRDWIADGLSSRQ
ncbi:hypothetical protein U9M48_038709 [Paspalum notatum var. saurae]|uniref:DDE Tnp4 domain-containing protein n=1 Tax=Paspalum notatum var. saurae TaxID=547442 RepID=A0AAQ3UJV1_PASNO